jgi:hypothetical protein
MTRTRMSPWWLWLAVCGAGCDGGTDPGQDCKLITQAIAAYDLKQDGTVPEGCWLVDEDLFVSNKATLKLMPGAQLRFKKETGVQIEADGSLSAEGTPAKPVVLTGREAQRGYWDGIHFVNSASDKNVISQATIEYAGAREMQDSAARPFRAALALASSGFEVRARLSQITIRQSSGYGFYFADTATVPDFSGNIITANQSGAGYVYARAAHNLSSASRYTGNDADLVFVNAGGEFGDQDRSWPALDVPYHMDGIFILYQHLTLAAGATLLFRKEAMIKVLDDKGGITAVGEAAKPITFAGTEPVAGHWGGLYFANTQDGDPTNPRTHLAYVTIEHGGSYIFNDSAATPVKGNLLLDSSGWNVAVHLSHSTVRKSSGWGVWLDCLGSLAGDSNTFSDNSQGDQGKEKDCS